MSRFRSVGVFVIFCSVLLMLAGCAWFEKSKTLAELGPYSAANPGPWKDAKISISFDQQKAPVKVTVKVDEYPARPDDFVQKFDLVNNEGTNVGQRVFVFGDKPEETFILDPDTKQVTVTIMSTKRGTWQSEVLPVPAVNE